MSHISVVIVDDHKLVRESWSFILNSDPHFKVIGETSDGNIAVDMCKALNPDIVLMDINMSAMNGFDATKLIRKQSPGTKIIGVSMHSMPVYAKKMLQSGASGYITKNSSKDELITGIMEVYNGNTFICEEVKNILAKQEFGDEDTDGSKGLNSLSKREIDIVQLIKDGFSSKEIADRLEISLKTVEVHRYNILKKLDLKNTAALVNFINRHGL